MSGGSSTNNTRSILTAEETVSETLRPLAEGMEHHEESLTSETGSGKNQPTGGAESEEELSMEGQQASEERTAELSEETNTEQDASVPTAITETPVPTSLEVSGNDALSQSEGPPKGVSQSSQDPDSFSDSCTHIAPSSDALPATLLSTETLGGLEFAQEEERLTREGIPHPLNGEGQLQEGEESDLSQRITDVGKQSDCTVDSEVGEQQRTEKTGEEGEPEVRRRRRSLLAALERIGRTEEEEEVEEEFQLPQQGEDSRVSLNKCILGALILLGLGTIFLSGAFMDLDEESDYGSRELRETEAPGKQEWLNPEGSPPPVDADKAELLNTLAKGNQQISTLQAQLQAQTEELNVAKGEAARGAKERLRWEEVEKENSRLKKETASLPVLQKENERMKRELESVPALQKELETLRSTVPEVKLTSGAGAAREAVQAPVNLTTSPSSGQLEDSMKDTAEFTERQPRKPWHDQTEKKRDVKKDKDDIREREGKERKRSEWKEGENTEHQEGGKSEWKKGKHEQGKFVMEKDKEGKQKWHSDETKQWKVEDWKGDKEKARTGDQGKSWKDREGKEWKEKSDSKEWTDEKNLEKAKREKVDEGKRWRSEEDKRDWKVRKEHGEKEWKKGKDGFKENGKDKWEKKDWKEKGEKKDWKKDRKDFSKEGKWKGERKRWEENKNHGKENMGKDVRKQWNENECKSKSSNHDREWKRNEWEKNKEQLKKGGQKEMNGWIKDKTSSPKYKEHKGTSDHGHGGERLWGDRKSIHKHRRPSVEQPEYWIHQRERFHHNPKSPQPCHSLETCAQAEGLLPVPFPDFEVILQTYLAKAEEAGVEASSREELKKVANEFFKDGVFVHDQTSFRDFVGDVGDVLEDMVEGGEDSAIEEEMEGFERAVMGRFSVPGAAVKEKRPIGEWRKERGRGHG